MFLDIDNLEVYDYDRIGLVEQMVQEKHFIQGAF